MNHNQLTDEELVVIVREKDTELFGEVVRRYQNKIFSYIARIINNREDAEDITQDVFIKVYKNLYGFDSKKKFSSWIYRIAHNESVNYIKKKSYFKVLSIDQNEFLKNTMTHTEDIIEKIIQKENAKKVRKLLDKLSFKYKEVLVLRYFEEKSYEEISDIIRKPTNTVGTMINRAKSQLESLMKKDNIEFG